MEKLKCVQAHGPSFSVCGVGVLASSLLPSAVRPGKKQLCQEQTHRSALNMPGAAPRLCSRCQASRAVLKRPKNHDQVGVLSMGVVLGGLKSSG